MGAPQIIVIIIYAMAIGIEATRHGQPKEGNHNVLTTLISVAINVAILWWGGFFG